MAAISLDSMLPDSSPPPPLVKCHPLVLFSILDSYTRRPTNSSRVIGTLLGLTTTVPHVLPDGSTGVRTQVEITNCFQVPHQEGKSGVAIGKDFNRQMLALSNRVNSKEKIVGWFGTTSKSGKYIVGSSSLVHDYYNSETRKSNTLSSASATSNASEASCIHLVVDTTLTDNRIGWKAYVSEPVSVRGVGLSTMYNEVGVGVVAGQCERVCMEKMINEARNGESKISDPKAPMAVSVNNMKETIMQLAEYLTAVNNGSIPKDDEIGAKINEALNSIPNIDPTKFDDLMNSNVQDLLMVKYLTGITRTQLKIAEKLNETITS